MHSFKMLSQQDDVRYHTKSRSELLFDIVLFLHEKTAAVAAIADRSFFLN
ncbi:hypothetical protein [Paenibacillus sp. Soil750]|nr:hypothetical protein [Paenibacillus sp. Soil750]